MVRYTGKPASKGGYFTDTLYGTSDDAVMNLNLTHWTNTAFGRQIVTSIRRTTAFEGGVAEGGAEATQTFVPNWDALRYGLGTTF